MSEMTSPEFRVFADTGGAVLLPIGSTEQHGPQLPLGTDWILAEEHCLAAATELGAIVAEPIRYGYRSLLRSGGGEHLPGTTSLDGPTFIAKLERLIVRFVADHVRTLVLVNGHLENEAFVAEACERVDESGLLERHGATLLRLNYFGGIDREFWTENYPAEVIPPLGLEHAGVFETSVMLHLRPELVRPQPWPVEPWARFPVYDRYPSQTSLVPRSGCLVPATGSSAEFGKGLCERSIAHLVAAIRAGRE